MKEQSKSKASEWQAAREQAFLAWTKSGLNDVQMGPAKEEQEMGPVGHPPDSQLEYRIPETQRVYSQSR